jgi:hypothetical protein
VFTGTGTYVVPATGGFWLNNPNFTVNGRGGDLEIDGTLIVDAGTLNIGTNANNRLFYLTGTVITINGGTINVASRLTAILGFGINYTPDRWNHYIKYNWQYERGCVQVST